MTKQTYIAKFDGEIVGTRQTERTYTHAVVVQRDVEYDRKEAYGYEATKEDRSSFNKLVWQAANVKPGVPTDLGPIGYNFSLTYNEKDIADFKAEIEGGFDGYVERIRQKHIKHFEERLANGAYKPGVITWCGRPDLAQKEAAKCQRSEYTRYTLVEIVDAEVAAKSARPVKSSIQRLR